MKILHAASELKPAGRKVCLAIGFFDGVHLGHQQILRQTVADARQHDALALALTFDRHPDAVVAPDRAPPLIYSLPQKLRAIQALGVETILLMRFDETFSRQTGEEFIRGLARGPGIIHSVCVGADFVFGHRRSGTVALLKKLGGELSFAVYGVAAVSLDGQTVSSTRIRELIGRGEMDAVGQMLGRPYSICGNVIAGDGLGQKLGFPTANLDVAGLILPPNGVYAGRARADGKIWCAALNIGVRPTVSSVVPRLCVEAHLLDFSGGLYGRELEIEIGKKLRDEKKFASLDDLKRQIAHDIEAVKKRG